MSIEKDLTRIADALETLVSKFSHIGDAISQTEADNIVKETQSPKSSPGNVAVSPSTPDTPAPAAKAPPPPPVKPTTTAPTAPLKVSTPVAPAQASTPPDAMTTQQLNTVLNDEYERLGSRGPIDNVIKGSPFNVNGISELPPEQYTALIEAVKAIEVG